MYYLYIEWLALLKLCRNLKFFGDIPITIAGVNIEAINLVSQTVIDVCHRRHVYPLKCHRQ